MQIVCACVLVRACVCLCVRHLCVRVLVCAVLVCACACVCGACVCVLILICVVRLLHFVELQRMPSYQRCKDSFALQKDIAKHTLRSHTTHCANKSVVPPCFGLCFSSSPPTRFLAFLCVIPCRSLSPSSLSLFLYCVCVLLLRLVQEEQLAKLRKDNEFLMSELALADKAEQKQMEVSQTCATMSSVLRTHEVRIFDSKGRNGKRRREGTRAREMRGDTHTHTYTHIHTHTHTYTHIHTHTHTYTPMPTPTLATHVQDEIAEEKARNNALAQEIRDMERKMKRKRQNVGGISGVEERKAKINSQVSTMENRLEKMLKRYNETLTENSKLRGNIDHLKQERKVFDTMHKRIEKELKDIKRRMAAVVEQSQKAHEARDEAQNKIAALEEKANKELQLYNLEIKELSRVLEHDRKLKTFMGVKALPRNLEEAPVSQKRKTKSADSPEQLVQTYDEAFRKIKASTGIEVCVYVCECVCMYV